LPSRLEKAIPAMQTSELQRKWDLTAGEIELLREERSFIFDAVTYRRTEDYDAVRAALEDHYRAQLRGETNWQHVAAQLALREARELCREQTSEHDRVHNIVTNQGLDHFLDVTLSAATQITTWYVAAVKTNTSAAAGMTYASPTYTEIAGSDVTETVRQAWTDGGVSSQSVSNSASPATYTADTTVTLYGASQVGGGTAATTIANTAGGGTLHSYALFGSSKAMTATDTIDITVTKTAADDGA
jgi:hypothetical protein